MTAECSLTVRSPSDLIAALPFVMGYHPCDSVAVVGLTRRQVDFGACYDLPPEDCAEADAQDAATSIAATIARQGADSVFLVGYGPAARVTPAVLRVALELHTLGVRVDDAIRVADGRWWSFFCEDATCCPPDGTPCLPEDSVIAAEATFRGQVALPSRRELVAQVARVEGPERAAMATATARARQRFTDLIADDLDAERYGRLIRRAGRAAVREAEKRYRSGRALSDDEAAWLGVLLVDKAVEDYALDRVADEEWRIRLWTYVLRRVEPPYVAAPACLLSFAAWRAGRGALARVAVDRALREDPGHNLAALMHEVLGYGLPPHAVIVAPSGVGGLRRGVRRRAN